MATYITVSPTLDIYHVRPYSIFSDMFNGYLCMDTGKSLIGYPENNSWLSYQLDRYNYKFNIDFETPQIISRIYYENFHIHGTGVENGVKYIDFYGSNSSYAFNNFEYDNITNLTLLWSGELSRHAIADVSDPHYIIFSNSNAYRYYIIRILNNWGGPAGMGLRRLELQEKI